MKKILLSFILISIGLVSSEAQTCAPPEANIISWRRSESNGLDARNLQNGKCSFTELLSGRFSERQKLLANPIVREQFGFAVAIDGDTMVIGANAHDTTPSTGINIGAAYVFVRSGGVWVQQAQLNASDGAAGDEFGYSVAVSGETIVVGAWRSNAPTSNSGAAYVFTRSGSVWTEQQKLTAADGAADDEFGNAVAISGDTIAVGSHSADQPSGGGGAGAVYIFNRSGTVWAQAQKLIPNGAVLFGDFLGESVALSGDTLAAGASGDQEPTRTNRGTVYVYTKSGGTWLQQQKLVVPDSQPSTQLGSSVAVDGDTIVSGALGDTPVSGQPNYGAAYVFARSGGSWSPQQRLTASDGATSDFFGWSVAVRSDTLVVGARHDDTAAGADAGSAYVFTRSGAVWTEKQKLAASDSAAADRFGTSISLSFDGTMAVGAPEKNMPGGQNAVGAVYVFNAGRSTPFDFDGDGKADIGIFRPSDGSWWYSRSLDNQFRVYAFGTSTDRLTPGDYTGDGRADIAVWRPSTGEWFIQRSEDNSYLSFPFGSSGDIPAPADFDGDGKADPAVFRPATATWFILKSTGGTSIFNFGANGDVPVAADYDGDGKADIAIYRPSVGQWWINRSSDSSVYAFQFGTSTDKPVPGDYTGDGRADTAFFRPSTGEWFILRSEDNSFYSVPFGAFGDIPASADYDGDGKFDTAVFRPSTANWFVQRSTGGVLITTFGTSGDRPIPNAFVP
ncbi:MAG TPA: FG-GAP-like repeat-containing protein [Pyrinomonadaceae bacterium]|nr:FG-GAP-like repeat-containing protein [Pyrinomonadaceae bacterium]